MKDWRRRVVVQEKNRFLARKKEAKTHEHPARAAEASRYGIRTPQQNGDNISKFTTRISVDTWDR